MKSFDKMGGIAALGHAAALVVGIGMAVTLVFPVLQRRVAPVYGLRRGQPVPYADLDPGVVTGVLPPLWLSWRWRSSTG